MTAPVPEEAGDTKARDDAADRLQRLLELQDLDLHRDQLRHRRVHLAEREELAGIESRVDGLARRAAGVAERRQDHADRQADLESEIAALEGRVSLIEQRSARGEAASYRDQESMALEIASLAAQKTEHEDSELAEMEAIELLDLELAGFAEEEVSLAAADGAARERLATAEEAIDAELADLAARRAPLAARIDAELLAEYERLRHRLGGIGVARLVRGTCSGCHLSLPATEVDRLRHAPNGTVTHCEQCGRLLVMAASG